MDELAEARAELTLFERLRNVCFATLVQKKRIDELVCPRYKLPHQPSSCYGSLSDNLPSDQWWSLSGLCLSVQQAGVG
ncbi:hypothetical protein M404DRAFT_991340 [Pisolithus tinctorius Marx 270]|uniref:Uncharacterized protein n=1 Tax=Pisolithus tinctorius Marx 270 TaxID=870435 RepID=A0A0C3JZI8_PISTI|nr:hypothetical protein M404DRAFT_991340 [Pisolithus tinctorius Marx 270]